MDGLLVNLFIDIVYIIFIGYGATFIFSSIFLVHKLEKKENICKDDIKFMSHIGIHYTITIFYVFIYIYHVILNLNRVNNGFFDNVGAIEYFRTLYEFIIGILTFLTIKHFKDEQNSKSIYFVNKEDGR